MDCSLQEGNVIVPAFTKRPLYKLTGGLHYHTMNMVNSQLYII
jgi:hypothetical protein